VVKIICTGHEECNYGTETADVLDTAHNLEAYVARPDGVAVTFETAWFKRVSAEIWTFSLGLPE